MRLVQPLPLFTCHCALGVGVPVAAAVNVAEVLGVAVAFDGFVVMVGATPDPVRKNEAAEHDQYCEPVSIVVRRDICRLVVGQGKVARSPHWKHHYAVDDRVGIARRPR